MSSDPATALGAAFVASVLTIIGARWVAGFQAKKTAEQELLRREHERDQARVADERSLPDAKRERLRVDYVSVTYAAEGIRSVSKQLMLLERGDTSESREERLRDQLEEATEDLGRGTVRLKLEDGTQHLLDTYQRVRVLWFTYQLQVPEADRNHNHTEASETLQKIEAEVEGIIARARADLEALGKAI